MYLSGLYFPNHEDMTFRQIFAVNSFFRPCFSFVLSSPSFLRFSKDTAHGMLRYAKCFANSSLAIIVLVQNSISSFVVSTIVSCYHWTQTNHEFL